MSPGRGLLITSGTLHQQPGLFFHLIQSELGDLYKVRSHHARPHMAKVVSLVHFCRSALSEGWIGCCVRGTCFEGSLQCRALQQQSLIPGLANWHVSSSRTVELICGLRQTVLSSQSTLTSACRAGCCAHCASSLSRSFRQVSLVVNDEQTEVTDISVEVSQVG